MNGRTEAEIARIEETQEALRDSIEETKRLAEEAETLLRVHKHSLQAAAPQTAAG